MEAEKVASPHQSNHHSSPDPECPRCEGLLVPTLLQAGPFDATVPSFPSAWRCINCGVLLDFQIMINRTSIDDSSSASKERAPQLKTRRPRGGPRVRLPLLPRRYTPSKY